MLGYNYRMANLKKLAKLSERADKLAEQYAATKAEIKAEVLALHRQAFARDIAATIGVEPQTVRAWWSEALHDGTLATVVDGAQQVV